MKHLLITLLLVFISAVATAHTDTLEKNKKLVIDFYTEVIFYGRHEAIDQYIGDVYIQHNPYIGDGKEALREFIKSLPPKDQNTPPRSKIVRVIAEGNLVVLHIKNPDWPAPNGGAVVDIFRVENGKLVEHWDVMQAIPETSANTNTMF